MLLSLLLLLLLGRVLGGSLLLLPSMLLLLLLLTWGRWRLLLLLLLVLRGAAPPMLPHRFEELRDRGGHEVGVLHRLRGRPPASGHSLAEHLEACYRRLRPRHEEVLRVFQRL